MPNGKKREDIDLCLPYLFLLVFGLVLMDYYWKGTAVPGAHSGPDSELFKFAFLDYERVGASYSMATALHETYVADVDKILKRLEVKKNRQSRGGVSCLTIRKKSAMEQKQALQREISAMEEELTK